MFSPRQVLSVQLLAAFFLMPSMAYPAADFDVNEHTRTTADRIKAHGYPAERHQVETEDNYVLTLFRIPYSHRLQNQERQRPAILLMHGLTSCSDAWILSGPNDALAFLLADAGYDVWLGNARGTTYCRNNTRLSPNHPYFWRFSWHEIGIFDLPAMIDYILDETGEQALHYVGHSQGTTVLFVLLAQLPNYNAKIKTGHALAPVAFMGNMSTILAKYTLRFIGRPNTLTRLLDSQELRTSSPFLVDLVATYCKKRPLLSILCSNIYLLLAGNDTANNNSNWNTTLAPERDETHPAGASTTQVLHYMQEYESQHFRQFDYAEVGNWKAYGQPVPPDYVLDNIRADLHLYYSDADSMANVKDVEYFASQLPKQPQMHHVPDPTFDHIDFIWAWSVKETINDPVIAGCHAYEEEHKNIFFLTAYGGTYIHLVHIIEHDH